MPRTQRKAALPRPEPWSLDVRPFVPGQDEEGIATVVRAANTRHGTRLPLDTLRSLAAGGGLR